jgi:uncharacterized membrane protein YhfC
LVNPFLLGSGIGMLLVGIISVVWWKRRSGVEMDFFFYGGIVWLVAIAIKGVMDYALSPMLYEYFSLYGLMAVLLASGVYVGLRTGLLESGLSYMFVIRSRLMRAGWKEAIAFGVGFGAAEAIFLGLSSFTSILVLVMFPAIMNSIPVEYQLQVLSQLEMGTEVIFAPMLERVFVMFAHVFAAVLVFMAVRSRKMWYLVLSIIYKTLLDGILPWLSYTLGTGDILSIYLMEIPIIIIGLIGYFGIRWLKPMFEGTSITGKAKSLLKKH